MEKTMKETIDAYIRNNIGELHELLEALVRIPAPSRHEEDRAAFCKKWLEAQGAEGVFIDEAKNCVYPINCEGRDDLVVFAAHTDTVFPDTEPFELKNDGKRFYAPGVGDDTACLAILLMTAKFFIRNGIKSNCGVLIVANACEEGLGNLKGVKQIMKDYAGRVRRFYTFDGTYDEVVCKCVGSYRYEIECRTEGGHSFSAFGKSNAIVELAEVIAKLYRVGIPQKAGTRTTYNVGMIEGGTSVNAIAQSAKMLYEYRSDDAECLDYMKTQFETVIEEANRKGKANFEVRTIGVRPCGEKVDPIVLNEMTERTISVCEACSGIPCKKGSGSTDCNIPMSLGVPSVCVGLYLGRGAHTREESLEIDSLPVGMNICFQIMQKEFSRGNSNGNI